MRTQELLLRGFVALLGAVLCIVGTVAAARNDARPLPGYLAMAMGLAVMLGAFLTEIGSL